MRTPSHFCMILSKIFVVVFLLESRPFDFLQPHDSITMSSINTPTFQSIATLIFLNIASFLDLLYFGVFDKFCRFPIQTSIPGFFFVWTWQLPQPPEAKLLISVASLRSQILVKRSSFKWFTFCWTGLRFGQLFPTSYWSKSRVEFF